MCVIIYLPIGKKLTDKNLRDAWDTNPDGAGMVYLNDGKIHVRKGYLNFDNFMTDCSDIINDVSLERVIHFRYTSKGTTNMGQTHPFPLTNNVKDLNRIEYTTTTPVLFHNGTLSVKVDKGLNDTQSWIKNDLYRYKDNLDGLFTILNVNSSRWCLVTPDGIRVTDDFHNKDGIYYSNLYWNPDWYISYFNKKSFKKPSYKKVDTLKDYYTRDADNFYWLTDPNHDYDNDEGCNHCYYYGIRCSRCFLSDEKYADEYICEYDHLSDNVTVYSIDSTEAK